MKSEQDLKAELAKIEQNYALHRREGTYNHGAIGEHIGPWQIGQIEVLRYVLEMPKYELPADIVLQEEIGYAEQIKYMDEQFEKSHGYTKDEWYQRVEEHIAKNKILDIEYLRQKKQNEE